MKIAIAIAILFTLYSVNAELPACKKGKLLLLIV